MVNKKKEKFICKIFIKIIVYKFFVKNLIVKNTAF